MGMHFWKKHVDDEHAHGQPGCISGLVHALGHHHWHYNVRKMIHHSKYEGQTGFKRDLSPKANLFQQESEEVEKLLDENKSPFLTTKRSRGTNKKSLKSRVRELIAEEMCKDGDDAKCKEAFLLKSRLQRTYSIHHLESLDGSIGKICTNWKHPIIIIPGKVETSDRGSTDTSQIKDVDKNEASNIESDASGAATSELIEEPDILDILKVDKKLFMRNLQCSEEGVVRFSRSALGLNREGKLSKSRSFPVHDSSRRLKFKPSKLVHKQKEIWLFSKPDKSRAVDLELKLAPLDDGTSSDQLAGDKKDKIFYQHMVIEQEKRRDNGLLMPSDIVAGFAEKREEAIVKGIGEYNNIKNYYHRRSSSLNESMDKYARLFENSYGSYNKLRLSKSLKLSNENVHAPMYFRRLHSVSNVDHYYSNLNFGVASDEPFKNGSNIVDSFAQDIAVDEEEKKVMMIASDTENEPQDLIEMVEYKTGSVDSFDYLHRMEDETNVDVNMVGNNCKEGEALEDESDELRSSDSLHVVETNCSSNDSDTFSQETLSNTGQLQTSKDKFVENFSHDGFREKNDSDLRYMRYVLDQSSIAENACDRAWHTSDQPLSPQLFEEVEAFWPHEADQFTKWPDQFTKWPDICGCWHHQMLFDSINEALVNIYDSSLPYYPKALSSSCHVRPFPVGNRINEEISTSIYNLLDMKSDEAQSLDCIVAHDLGNDTRWMNLQFESECVALELEDMIFNEFLEEFASFNDETEILV